MLLSAADAWRQAGCCWVSRVCRQ